MDQQLRQQPTYDTKNGGHYGASAALSAAGFAPAPELYSGIWANVNQGLSGQSKDILTTYWQQMIHYLENEQHDYKIHQLPLARIKKVMKADPEVKMISAEAPILFAKGCDIFITELTMRAWTHAEDNKRRTLQRSDIAAALAKSDMFDFLIDIVPREDASGHSKRSGGASAAQQSAAGQPAGGQPGVPQQQPGQQGQPPHHMGHPGQEYGNLAQHAMAQESDYRGGVPGAGIYGGHVQDPNVGGYPPQQMQGFSEMYNPYQAHMPPQQ